MMGGAFIDTIAPWCMATLVLAMGVTMLRLLRGPTGPDRVMAMDLITILAAGVLGTLSLVTDDAAYLSVALVVTLISFLGTVAFAVFLQRVSRRSGDNP